MDTSTSPPNSVPNELSTEFIDVQLLARVAAANVDIRTLPRPLRYALLTGPKVMITIDNEVVSQLPKPLLKATSSCFSATRFEGIITLPEDTDEDSVRYFAKHIADVAIVAGIFKHRRSLSSFVALIVCGLG